MWHSIGVPYLFDQLLILSSYNKWEKEKQSSLQQQLIPRQCQTTVRPT